MGKGSVGVVLVLMSAVAFGLMPILAKLAYTQGVGIDELLFVRFLLAFLIMGVILGASHQLAIPERRALLVLIGLGAVAYYLQSTLYFTSLLYSPVAIVALLLYTYPIFVTIGAFALGWERVSRRLVVAFLIALLGLFLVANPFGSAIGLGVLLALGSSITYTFYILGGSKVLRKVRGELAAFYVMGAGSVSFGLAGAATRSIHLNWSFEGWLLVLAMALGCTVIGVTAFFMGIVRIGPSRAALISLLEPVTSIAASLAIFGNELNLTQWFGGAMILTATAITIIYGAPEPHPLA